MDAESPNQRLSRISTLWTLVHQAHQRDAGCVPLAQQQLLEHYGGAIHRYLLGALRDPEAADDLFQDFCVRFLRGDFHRADPEKGRFRDFVKTALFHLIVDHQQRQKRRPQPLETPGMEPATADPEPAEKDQAFLAHWREELLDRTWLALEAWEQASGQPVHTILRLRTDQPLLSSAELATRLGERLDRRWSVDGFRHALQRAREKFADLLLQEVIHSLERPSRERLEQELDDLGILAHCRSALDRSGLV
jgi:RNA polymerase sigma-70 factor (ECF subfamily)